MRSDSLWPCSVVPAMTSRIAKAGSTRLVQGHGPARRASVSGSATLGGGRCNEDGDCASQGLTAPECLSGSFRCIQNVCTYFCNLAADDQDMDDVGDAEDPCPFDPANDEDGDGICGNEDNCPKTFNPGQEDSDEDGVGDLCEAGKPFEYSIEEIPDGLVVRYTAEGISLNRRKTPLGEMVSLSMDGLSPRGPVGRPALPVKHLVIEVPWEVEDVEIVTIQRDATRQYDQLLLYPEQDGEDPDAFHYDRDYYQSRRAPDPDVDAISYHPGVMRHRRLFGLDIFPVHYLASDRRVVLTTSGEVGLRFICPPNPRPRPSPSPSMDAVVDRIIANPGMVPAAPPSPSGKPKFVVVAPGALLNDPVEGNVIEKFFIGAKPDKEQYEWVQFSSNRLAADCETEQAQHCYLADYVRERLKLEWNATDGDMFVLLIGNAFQIPPGAEKGTGLFGTNVSRYSVVEITGELELDDEDPVEGEVWHPRYLVDCGDWCDFTLGDPSSSASIRVATGWTEQRMCEAHDVTPRLFGLWLSDCSNILTPDCPDLSLASIKKGCCMTMTLDQARFFTGSLTPEEEQMVWPRRVKLNYTMNQRAEFTIELQQRDLIDPDGDGWVPFRVRVVNYGENIALKVMRRNRWPSDPFLQSIDHLAPSRMLKPEHLRVGPGHLPGQSAAKLRYLGAELDQFCGIPEPTNWPEVLEVWLNPSDPDQQARVIEIPNVELEGWEHLPSYWKGCKKCPSNVPTNQDEAYWGFSETDSSFGYRLGPIFFVQAQNVGDYHYTLLGDDLVPKIPMVGRIPIKGDDPVASVRNAFHKIIAYQTDEDASKYTSRVLLIGSAADVDSAGPIEKIRRSDSYDSVGSWPTFVTNYTFALLPLNDPTTPIDEATETAVNKTVSTIESGVGLVLAEGHGTYVSMPTIAYYYDWQKHEVTLDTVGQIGSQPFFPVATASTCMAGGFFERYWDYTVPENTLTRFADRGFSQLALANVVTYGGPMERIKALMDLVAHQGVVSQSDSPSQGSGILWMSAMMKTHEPTDPIVRNSLVAWHLFGDPTQVLRFAADVDDDGVPNASDNCMLVANSGEDYPDMDGVGDACDDCPGNDDFQQWDLNSNLIGDACEGQSCNAALREDFGSTGSCGPVFDWFLSTALAGVSAGQATIVSGAHDHCLRCETDPCPNETYRVSFRQKRVSTAWPRPRGVVCMKNAGVLNDDCQEFELSDDWEWKTVRVKTGASPEAVYFGARGGLPPPPGWLSWPGSSPAYRIDEVAVVKDNCIFQGWNGEAWEVSPGGRWASRSPLADGPDLAGAGIRGAHLEIRVGDDDNQPVCVQAGTMDINKVVPEGGLCPENQAEPVGMPTVRCPVTLNAAFKDGDRYLVSVDYLTRHPSWMDHAVGLPTGAFVQYVAPTGVPMMPATIWNFPLTPSEGMPARAIFVMQARGDATLLSFCQRGFGHYLIDNIRVWRLP